MIEYTQEMRIKQCGIEIHSTSDTISILVTFLSIEKPTKRAQILDPADYCSLVFDVCIFVNKVSIQVKHAISESAIGLRM